jgi:large subunit ribosomal protein L22
MPKKSAVFMKKLVESAVANAEQKKVIDIDNLYVKTVLVDEGPDMKRYRPRAQGRAFMIRKKTSHVSLVLDER